MAQFTEADRRNLEAAARDRHLSNLARHLNDDDIYIVNLRTKTVRTQIASGSVADTDGRRNGFPVPLNHAALTGLQARMQGVLL